MRFSPLLTTVFACCFLASCNNAQTALAPQPPSVGVQILPASNGIASGTLASGARLAVAGALSATADRSAAGAMQVFATTTVIVGSGGSVGPTSQLRGLQMLYATALPAPRPRLEAHPPDDSVGRRLLRAVRATQPQAKLVRHAAETTIPTVLQVGSTVANIWVSKFQLGGGDATYLLLPMTLEAQTAHGNIWIDNSLLAGPHASPSFGAASATQSGAVVGQDFEIGYASDTSHFAAPDYPPNAPGILTENACDETGRTVGQSAATIAEPLDRRINVVVLNAASDTLGDGVGGFFTMYNFVPQAVLNCGLPMGITLKSNEAPMIYVAWNDSLGATTELTDDQITATAHELQHLINFVNHSLLPAGADNPNFQDSETLTNNEGLSMISQDFAIQMKYPSFTFDALDALPLAKTFLTNPQSFSLTGFIGSDPGSNRPIAACRGCYGDGYLFQRYMYDHFGGDAYTHAMEKSGLTGFANLAASCACKQSVQQMLQNYFIAMGAASIGATPANAAYQFGTLKLNGNYQSPVAGQPTTNLVGVNKIVVPIGESVSATVPLGGAAFFSISPSGTITFKDANPAAGFGLTGALVQF